MYASRTWMATLPDHADNLPIPGAATCELIAPGVINCTSLLATLNARTARCVSSQVGVGASKRHASTVAFEIVTLFVSFQSFLRAMPTRCSLLTYALCGSASNAAGRVRPVQTSPG